MERENTIRAHHLAMWGDILPEYMKYSQGKKPWEIPSERFSETASFVARFAKKQTDKDVEVIKEFEKYDIDNDNAEEEYLYRIDMVGANNESHQKVLMGRIKHFLKVFETISKDKNTMFLLSSEPDGYCKACAIGNHCREIGPDYASNDMRHLKVLKTSLGYPYYEKEMLQVTEEGNIYISAELLFDEEFHKLVQEGVKKERERCRV